MGLHLNADEVFELAQRIEQNGALFHRRVAELKEDNSDTGFLLHLAEMEDEHERIFREIQDQLSDSERSRKPADPFGEMWMYLGAVADTSGGEGSMVAFESFTGKKSMFTPVSHFFQKYTKDVTHNLYFYLSLDFTKNY